MKCPVLIALLLAIAFTLCPLAHASPFRPVCGVEAYDSLICEHLTRYGGRGERTVMKKQETIPVLSKCTNAKRFFEETAKSVEESKKVTKKFGQSEPRF